MARFSGGWIKIYREILGTDIGKHPTRFSLFMHLIAMANVEPTWVDWLGKPRRCERGSLVTSYRELANVTGSNTKMVERQLKYLALRDTVAVESVASGSYITIKNYSDYQDNKTNDVVQKSYRRHASVDTDGDTDGDYKEELRNKEIKNKEEYISTEPKNSVAVAKPKKELVEFKLSDSKTISVTKDLIDSWIDTFPKEFLDEEIKKARSWVLSNSHKAPKSNWGRFLNSWFNRGWDRYRQNLKSNPTKLTLDDLNEALGRL